VLDNALLQRGYCFFVAGCLDDTQREDPSFRVRGVATSSTHFAPSSFDQRFQPSSRHKGIGWTPVFPFLFSQETTRIPNIQPFQSFSFGLDTQKFSFVAKANNIITSFNLHHLLLHSTIRPHIRPWIHHDYDGRHYRLSFPTSQSPSSSLLPPLKTYIKVVTPSNRQCP